MTPNTGSQAARLISARAGTFRGTMMQLPNDGPAALTLNLREGVEPLRLTVEGAAAFAKNLRDHAALAQTEARTVELDIERGEERIAVHASPTGAREWAKAIEDGLAIVAESRRLAGAAPVGKTDTITRDSNLEIRRVETVYQY